MEPKQDKTFFKMEDIVYVYTVMNNTKERISSRERDNQCNNVLEQV